MTLKFEGPGWKVSPKEGATDNAARVRISYNLSPVKLGGQDLTINATLSEESTFEDKEAIHKLAEGAEFAVDVGSFLGSSAHAILSNESVRRLICVDHFMGTRAIDSETGQVRGNTAITSGWMALLGLHTRLIEFNGRFTIWVGGSDALASVLQDGIADFIFIDAAHTYDWVKLDIEKWLPKLKPTGILAGHDFDKPLKDKPEEELAKLKKWEVHEGLHPGVVLAVKESFEHYELVEHENSSVWWAKPEWYKKPV